MKHCIWSDRSVNHTHLGNPATWCPLSVNRALPVAAIGESLTSSTVERYPHLPTIPNRRVEGRGLHQCERAVGSVTLDAIAMRSFASRATIFSMTDLENLFAGFALGMCGSLLTWFWITRRYRPRFMVSTIARSFDPASPSDISYRIKVLNLSRKRGLTDLSIHCRVFIQGLPDEPEREETHSSFHIPVGDGKGVFPYIENGKGRIFGIHPENLDRGGGSLPDQVLQQMHSRQRSLEQLLRYTGENAYVRIVVVATDDFSGLRASKQLKVTVQRSGAASKIIPGGFPSPSTVEIEPNEKYKETAEDEAPQPGDLNTYKAT